MLQEDITKSENWAEIWEMLFNLMKCHHMHIGQEEPNQYTMGTGENKIIIETVKNKNDLGVTIDKELKFRDHII